MFAPKYLPSQSNIYKWAVFATVGTSPLDYISAFRKKKKNTVKVQDSVYLSTHTKIETELSRCRTLGR